ncbi:MAG: class B sortase [Acetanaerobacterium sp.]
MKARILLIGSDTAGDEKNIRLLQNELRAFSIETSCVAVSLNNPDAFLDAVGDGIDNCDILFTVGGQSDISRPFAKELLCDALDIALLPHNPSLARLHEVFDQTGRHFVEEDVRFALVPEGARVFVNTVGFVSGFSMESQGQAIVMLPDNPKEYIAMFTQSVCSYIRSGTGGEFAFRTLRLFGISFEEAQQVLADMVFPLSLSVTLLEDEGELVIRVFAVAPGHSQALSQADAAANGLISGALARHVYGGDNETLAGVVVNKLRRHSRKIATAESCTGGLLSEKITEVSGSSEVFEFGVSAYADKIKRDKLGVSPKLIARHTSVSEEVAIAMAAGVMKQARADLGVGITGVAGPNTDENAKPVGLVYIALCDKNRVWVKRLTLDPKKNNRDAVRNKAVLTVLDMVNQYLDVPSGVPDDMVPFTLHSTKSYEQAAECAREQYNRVPNAGEPGLQSPLLMPGESEEQVQPGKKSVGRRFVEYMFPVKGDSGSRVFLKLLSLLFIVVFLAAACYIGYYYGSAYLNRRNVDEINTLYGTGSLPEGYPADYIGDFAALYAVNTDVKAFIEIENTGVKYPVVQASDNDYYLRRNFSGESNRHGIPFMDFNVDISNSTNIVVYGHNMKDGQMFGELIGYKDVEYYKEHPVIGFDTVYGTGSYKIVSAFITNVNPAHGQIFDYTSFINPQTEDEISDFITQVKARSLIDTGVDVNADDSFLTLSTCSYEFDNARFVIVARKVRSGESDVVEVLSAKRNAQPLYPDIWYELYGGEKPAPPAQNETGLPNGETPPPLVAQPDDGLSTASSQISSEEQTDSEQSSKEASSSKSESSSKVASSSSQVPSSQPQSSSEQGEISSEAGSDVVDQSPPSSSQTPSSRTDRPSSADSSEESSEVLGVSKDEELSVYANGSYVTDDAYTILCKVVANELNDTVDTEALKAQAVAAHSYIVSTINNGSTPSVGFRTPTTKIKNAVAAVVDEFVYVNNRVAYTPYFAIAADNTNSSKDVWGGYYSHLVSVESEYDKNASGYKRTTKLSESYVSDKVTNYFDEEPEGDPSEWFVIKSYTSGDYNDKMSIGGISTTAREIREKVLVSGGAFDLRSTKFDVTYNDGSFTFTTYGYGHGVGMSQMGADGYAKNEGWTYKQILEHYYTGSTVK